MKNEIRIERATRIRSRFKKTKVIELDITDETQKSEEVRIIRSYRLEAPTILEPRKTFFFPDKKEKDA